MDSETDPTELIYRPAKRERVGLIIGLSGPSWSGKTFTALRLARGMAGPTGRIAVLDTEMGRALTYADDFEFDHAELHEPFSPNRYAAAAAASKRAGHDVLIVDSMSHEHAGPGGVLEMHEAELNRLTQGSNDYARREAMKMVAWIRPKTAHKAMVQRLLQLNSHLILCFRAEEKTEIQMLPNKQGKLVNTPVSIGYQPITVKDMVYEMTVMLGFNPKNPGVPIAIKLADKFKPFVPLDRQLDQDVGARLAAWARGETPTVKSTPPPPDTTRPPAQPPGPGHWRALADDERLPPGAHVQTDMTTGQTMLWQPDPPPPNKNEAVVLSIIAGFEALQDQAGYWTFIDDAERRRQTDWFKDKKPELHARIDAAMKAAQVRLGLKETTPA